MEHGCWLMLEREQSSTVIDLTRSIQIAHCRYLPFLSLTPSLLPVSLSSLLSASSLGSRSTSVLSEPPLKFTPQDSMDNTNFAFPVAYCLQQMPSISSTLTCSRKSLIFRQASEPVFLSLLIPLHHSRPERIKPLYKPIQPLTWIEPTLQIIKLILTPFELHMNRKGSQSLAAS